MRLRHTAIRLAGFAVAVAFALPAGAEPRAYMLETDESRVEFGYTLMGNPGTGTMPVRRADLVIDFNALDRSSARVTLDAAAARTGAVFVTEALKGGSVLDTDTHPAVTFVSRSFAKAGDGARIAGDVTIRGVTRPLTLEAEIYRRRGSEPGDLSRLTVLLTGAIDRRDFGASGFPDMVAPEVRLRIVARLRQADR